MKSLILSSGFGTRLYPLTVSKAKGLLKYKGRPLISHIVSRVPQALEILVNINKKFEADFCQWQKSLDREVTLCVEPVCTEEQSFGALGSVDYWVRAKNIIDDLLLVASDNYFEFDLSQFIAAYNGKNTLVAVHDIGDRSKASQYGVVQLDGHNIIEFDEKPPEPKSSLIATACWVLPSRVFPLLSEFCARGSRTNLGTFITYLIGIEEVHAYAFTELWFDVGSIDVYNSLQLSL